MFASDRGTAEHDLGCHPEVDAESTAKGNTLAPVVAHILLYGQMILRRGELPP